MRDVSPFPTCGSASSARTGSTSVARRARKPLDIEADEFLGRVFQHEVDHLDGVLMLERLDEDMRKQALRVLRDRELGFDTSAMEEKLVRPEDRESARPV